MVLLPLSCVTDRDSDPFGSAVRPGRLKGKTIAILATDGVEHLELLRPREALEAAGANTVLVSSKRSRIVSYEHDERWRELRVDISLGDADANAFDGLTAVAGHHAGDGVAPRQGDVDGGDACAIANVHITALSA